MTKRDMSDLTDLAEKAAKIANRAGRPSTAPRNEVPAVTLDGTTARLRLYQAIDDWGGSWGMSAVELLEAIDALPSNIDTIELSINSPGGIVFEAIAMMNALRRHEARVVVVVDGLAASAASFIAASADETVMMPNAQMMIHAAWGMCIGDGGNMREYADVLDAITLNICDVYEQKSGTPAGDWLDMMTGTDVWLTAEKAVELGLADRVGIEGAGASASHGGNHQAAADKVTPEMTTQTDTPPPAAPDPLNPSELARRQDFILARSSARSTIIGDAPTIETGEHQ